MVSTKSSVSLISLAATVPSVWSTPIVVAGLVYDHRPLLPPE